MNKQLYTPLRSSILSRLPYQTSSEYTGTVTKQHTTPLFGKAKGSDAIQLLRSSVSVADANIALPSYGCHGDSLKRRSLVTLQYSEKSTYTETHKRSRLPRHLHCGGDKRWSIYVCNRKLKNVSVYTIATLMNSSTQSIKLGPQCIWLLPLPILERKRENY